MNGRRSSRRATSWTLEMAPEGVWDGDVGVNLKGTFLMSKHATSRIRTSGGDRAGSAGAE